MAALDNSAAMVTGQQYTFWFSYSLSNPAQPVPATGSDVQAALAGDQLVRFGGVAAQTALIGPGNLSATFTWSDPLDDALGAPLAVGVAGKAAQDLINAATSAITGVVTFVEADQGGAGLFANWSTALLVVGGIVLLVVILGVYQDVREV